MTNNEQMPELGSQTNPNDEMGGLRPGQQPDNFLESQWLTIDPAHGKEVTKGVFDLLGEKYGVMGLLGRDWRLANLSSSEIRTVNHFLGIGMDCAVLEGYKKSTLTAIEKAAITSELSQSRGGFFRKRLGTRTKEEVSHQHPSNNKLMGGSKDE